MVRYVVTALSALLIGWGISASPAEAQLACGDRGTVVASLHKKFSETPVSIGLASNGTVIEVFASPQGTWTIVMTKPDGESCVLMAGDNWEDLPTQVADTGA